MKVKIDKKTREELRESRSWDDWDRAYELARKNAPSKGLSTEGRAYHWNGEAWTEIPLPGSSPYVIKDIFIETPDRVWMVGSRGTILVGNARSGFSNVGFAGDTETLLSIIRFKDKYIVASDYALHIFDGHHLTPLKPRLRRRGGAPTPLRVQAVHDVLFYFDYKLGVHRFDGNRWEEIPIPPELLARDFRGLVGRGP
ncbi:hypothetical protein [Methylobacterium sp. Leaf102]|uniref:hypothetical protein n=1 Tax=Methylobacterium sp. Leaf102 TaxID=1736253 RepID=UPI001FCE0FDD|nr:hypothetical protein [Methylobacterium sp. Leaf102]